MLIKLIVSLFSKADETSETDHSLNRAAKNLLREARKQIASTIAEFGFAESAKKSALLEIADSRQSMDYDGDGVSDISVYRPSNRTWYIRPKLYKHNSNQTMGNKRRQTRQRRF